MLSALGIGSGHRSIRFKRLEGHPSLYSARVGIHYRAIAQREGDLMIWVWIGHHSEYDALLRRRQLRWGLTCRNGVGFQHSREQHCSGWRCNVDLMRMAAED